MSITESNKRLQVFPTKWDEAISDANCKIRGLKRTIGWCPSILSAGLGCRPAWLSRRLATCHHRVQS